MKPQKHNPVTQTKCMCSSSGWPHSQTISSKWRNVSITQQMLQIYRSRGVFYNGERREGGRGTAAVGRCIINLAAFWLFCCSTYILLHSAQHVWGVMRKSQVCGFVLVCIKFFVRWGQEEDKEGLVKKLEGQGEARTTCADSPRQGNKDFGQYGNRW